MRGGGVQTKSGRAWTRGGGVQTRSCGVRTKGGGVWTQGGHISHDQYFSINDASLNFPSSSSIASLPL